MTRYDFHSGQGEPFMREVPNGKWVLAEDVQQLEQRIGSLREALTKAEGFVNRHSEDWYTSGQRLLTEIRAALKESE